MHFEHHRLPELFTGFSREDCDVPIRYPVACHPQAWAAGSVPYLVQTLLGIQAGGFNHRLRIVRPVPPGGLDRLELHQLPLAQGHVSLRFSRTPTGACAVETLATDRVEVVVEPGGSPLNQGGA
jgi:glycogen debranching enzyme